MQEASSSLKCYEYRHSDQGLVFDTHTGAQYSVYFTEGDGYFPKYDEFKEHVRSHGFSKTIEAGSAEPIEDPTTNQKSRPRRQDDGVRNTIFSIIQEALLRDPKICLFSICDTKDQRQLCRHKLFSKWHIQLQSLVELCFVKYDYALCDEKNENCVYLSMLIPKICPHHEPAKTAFFNINEDLKEKGY